MSARTTSQYWKNPSVVAFAQGQDPVITIVDRVQSMVLNAVEHGWDGPPFDPFALADLLKISVIPFEGVRDARLVPERGGRLRIEYNPNRSKARIRYSIAHEIGHTLFPDCRERIRNRAARFHVSGEDWQLEMLCNIAAAEILMPVGSVPELEESAPSIDELLSCRDEFDVSAEAMLIRLARLARHPFAAFAASCDETGSTKGRLRIDYVISPTGWGPGVTNGSLLPEDSELHKCSALGFTAKADEKWAEDVGKLHVEAVAVPAYPGKQFPRVVGFASPLHAPKQNLPTIEYLVGDATKPRGRGLKIVAHVVNDRAARWGAGFARAVRTKWPAVQTDFIKWTEAHRSRFVLGESHRTVVDDDLVIVHMICQHGYGPSPHPRIRYNALEHCLSDLASFASDHEYAGVHIPRIGCGEARGNWNVVAELIDLALCRRNIPVTVYDLPAERKKWNTSQKGQMSLFNA